jgi:CRISPR-associated protein Csd1
MMLQALIAYAERKKLGESPDFEPVGIRWLIPLDARGKLAGGPIPQFEDGKPDSKKPKPRRVVRPKSDPDFVGHGRSYFLCDTLDRCLLLTDDEAKQAKRKVNQDYFIQLMENAAKDCPGERTRLQLMASFLRDADQLKNLHAKLTAKKADPSEKAAFQVDGVELLKSEELFAWWQQQCERERAVAKNEQAVCLATGRFGPVCRTTGFIKGLTEDTKLISFNKQCPAFESYGLEQAANAPISVEAEEKFRSALDDLIQRSRYHRLEFNGTFYLHWTKEDVYDPTDLLAEPNPQEIANLLKSVERGGRYAVDNPNDYFAAAVCANGPRLVVRDWIESTVPIVSGNIARWFRDLRIVEPSGQNTKCEFSLWELMSTLVTKKGGKSPDWKRLPPQVATETLFATMRGDPDALQGQTLPSTALVLALQRQTVEFRKPGDKFDPKLNPARLALIKACLLRPSKSQNNNTQTKDNIMTECLNPESRDSAYLCGRLFAVFDRLQELGLPGVNAGVVQRYYASASTTPAIVMGRLFRNAQFHLDKTESRWGGGAAENVRKHFEEITCALGDKFPATLDLEGQGRFALGYYHQKADFRRRTAERKEAEAKAEAAA